MEETTITAIGSVIVSIIGAVVSIAVARINARASAKKEVNTRAEGVLVEAKEAFESVRDIDKKIENGLSRGDRSPSQTENIDRAWIEALTQFVEAYRVKIDVLELFGVDIPADFYYNFAVYYAFVRRDWVTGNYFIDKTLKASQGLKIEDSIDFLRWAARINRLNRNETEAARTLTRIINVIGDPGFSYKGMYNDLYRARLYRSRGFCYFNKNDNYAAIQDFNRAVDLAGKDKEIKIAYCYCGLAMAIYREHKRSIDAKTLDEVVGYYKEAKKREPWLYGQDAEEFWHNLERLEHEKKYYITELEKETLEKVYDLYQSREG